MSALRVWMLPRLQQSCNIAATALSSCHRVWMLPRQNRQLRPQAYIRKLLDQRGGAGGGDHARPQVYSRQLRGGGGGVTLRGPQAYSRRLRHCLSCRHTPAPIPAAFLLLYCCFTAAVLLLYCCVIAFPAGMLQPRFLLLLLLFLLLFY